MIDKHQKPCACFKCDKLPKRLRYTEAEWEKTYPDNDTKCKFCGRYAGEHAGSWHSSETGGDPDEIYAGGFCKMLSLLDVGLESNTWYKHRKLYSSDFFYIPANDT